MPFQDPKRFPDSKRHLIKKTRARVDRANDPGYQITSSEESEQSDTETMFGTTASTSAQGGLENPALRRPQIQVAHQTVRQFADSLKHLSLGPSLLERRPHGENVPEHRLVLLESLYKPYSDINSDSKLKDGEHLTALKDKLATLLAERDTITNQNDTHISLLPQDTPVIDLDQGTQSLIDARVAKITYLNGMITQYSDKIKEVVITKNKFDTKLELPHDHRNLDEAPFDSKDLQRNVCNITCENNTSNLRTVWDRLMRYTAGQRKSHAYYIKALACLIKNDEMYEVFTSVHDKPLPQVLDKLYSIYCKESTILEHKTHIENFVRNIGESLRSAISRYDILLFRTELLFAPDMREKRAELNRAQCLYQICSHSAKKELDALLSSRARHAQTAPFEAQLDLAAETEAANRDAPTHVVSTNISLNAFNNAASAIRSKSPLRARYDSKYKRESGSNRPRSASRERNSSTPMELGFTPPVQAHVTTQPHVSQSNSNFYPSNSQLPSQRDAFASQRYPSNSQPPSQRDAFASQRRSSSAHTRDRSNSRTNRYNRPPQPPFGYGFNQTFSRSRSAERPHDQKWSDSRSQQYPAKNNYQGNSRPSDRRWTQNYQYNSQANRHPQQQKALVLINEKPTGTFFQEVAFNNDPSSNQSRLKHLARQPAYTCQKCGSPHPEHSFANCDKRQYNYRHTKFRNYSR